MSGGGSASAAVPAPRMSGGVVVTHDGLYHADEVAAIAFYILGYGTPTIVRTRDEERLAYYKRTARTYKRSVMMFDVGGEYDPENNLFDHHMYGCKEYFSDDYRPGSPSFNSPTSLNHPRADCWMSSFGMFYKHHGLEILGNYMRQNGAPLSEHQLVTLWKIVYARLVVCIDYADNTGLRHPLEASFPALVFICGMCNRVYQADSRESREVRDPTEGFLRTISIFREIISISIDFLWKEHCLRSYDSGNIEHTTTLVRNARVASGSRGIVTMKYIIVDRRDRPIWATVKRISPDIGHIIVLHPANKACLHCAIGSANIDKDLCESQPHKDTICSYSLARRQAFFNSPQGAVAYLNDLADVTERKSMEKTEEPEVPRAGSKREREETGDVGRESVSISGEHHYPSMSPPSQPALPSPLEVEREGEREGETGGGPSDPCPPYPPYPSMSTPPSLSAPPPGTETEKEADDSLYGFFGPYE